MKVTQWFSNGEKPTRIGYYEVKWGKHILRDWYDGKMWMPLPYTNPWIIQNRPWRGLNKSKKV